MEKIDGTVACDIVICHVQPAIAEQQHGFIPGRDCSSNLTSLLQDAYHAVERR